jgi:hypothetical protein
VAVEAFKSINLLVLMLLLQLDIMAMILIYTLVGGILLIYIVQHRRVLLPTSLHDLKDDESIRPPIERRKRGRPKTSRTKRRDIASDARKCGRCGEVGHNVRTCLGLGPVGRGERALEWRRRQAQGLQDCEADVMMEAIEQEVEAQVLRETRGDSEGSGSDSELSVLHSSDFEGMYIR